MVDMTMGNGHDSLKLMKHFSDAYLYAFDIQEVAIENTRKLLVEKNYLDRARLILDSHTNIDKYVSDVDLVLYNFGFLPKADHNIHTFAESSLESLKKALILLNLEGLIFMVFYPGHEEGKKEYEVIKNFLERLDQKVYSVIEYKYLNQINNPPILIVLERIS